MKVVFHSSSPLPVKDYGGIERIVYWHMVELVKQGHEIVLIGHPDCQVSADGIEHLPYAPSDLGWENLIPADTDIAHLSYNHQVSSGLPTLSTVHGNAQIGEKLRKNSVFVSKKHAQNHGGEFFVYNALDFSEYPFDDKREIKWDHFLFLAKASWRVKNLKHTIKACSSAKKALEIIGGRGLLPRPRIKSHGIVGGSKKLEIINQCDALIFPVRWQEPFGIAIIEAMALGLPVIGSSYGSLPELITNDTGIICKNFEELCQAVATDHSSRFSPSKIRESVQKRFNISDHTRSYIQLYEKILSGESLHQSKLELQASERAETLLPF